MEGDLRIGSVSARTVSFRFDGEMLTAREGETLAAALYAQGRRTLRTSRDDGGPRGELCPQRVALRPVGIGLCCRRRGRRGAINLTAGCRRLVDHGDGEAEAAGLDRCCCASGTGAEHDEIIGAAHRTDSTISPS